MSDGRPVSLDNLAGPVRALLPDIPAARELLLALHGTDLAAIPAELLLAPLSEGSVRAYAARILNLRRFALHEEWIDDLDELEALTLVELRVLIEEWITWRATPIEDDHPLSLPAADSRGERSLGGWRDCEPRSDLRPLRHAVTRWSLTHGLGDLLTNRALAVNGPAKPLRPARGLTEDELERVLTRLHTGDVIAWPDAQRTEGWHHRQLAATTIAICGSLRPRAEFPMLRDENVVEFTTERLAICLPRTKMHLDGRVVVLEARSDLLCPVRALARWLLFCQQAGWDRDGLLLPAVQHPARLSPVVHPTRRSVMARPWRLITEALDIELDPEGLAATPHGLRSMALTRGVRKGLDIHDLLRLGGWETLSSALRYDRARGSDAVARAVADDLARGCDSPGTEVVADV